MFLKWRISKLEGKERKRVGKVKFRRKIRSVNSGEARRTLRGCLIKTLVNGRLLSNSKIQIQ